MVGCTPASTVNSSTGSSLNPVSTSPAAASPTPTNPGSKTAQNPQVVAAGNLVKGEHDTSGRVQIVQRGNERILELGADFKTFNMGPDLVVILHRSPDVIGSTVPPAYPINEGDYVLLAPLKSFNGAQSYPIPANINLADYPSAAIWCRKFNATFGAARLR
jgi:hypothetical protein